MESLGYKISSTLDYLYEDHGRFLGVDDRDFLVYPCKTSDYINLETPAYVSSAAQLYCTDDVSRYMAASYVKDLYGDLSHKVHTNNAFKRYETLGEQTRYFQTLHGDLDTISNFFQVGQRRARCITKFSVQDFCLNYDDLLHHGIINNIAAQVHVSRKIVEDYSFHFKGNYKEKVLAVSERLKQLKTALTTGVTAEGLIEARRLSSMLKNLLSANYSEHKKAVKNIVECTSLHYLQDLRKRLRSRSPQLFKCLDDFSGCEEEVNAGNIHRNFSFSSFIKVNNVRQKAITEHNRQYTKDGHIKAYRRGNFTTALSKSMY